MTSGRTQIAAAKTSLLKCCGGPGGPGDGEGGMQEPLSMIQTLCGPWFAGSCRTIICGLAIWPMSKPSWTRLPVTARRHLLGPQLRRSGPLAAAGADSAAARWAEQAGLAPIPSKTDRLPAPEGFW